MTPAQQAKAAGLKSLAEVAQITGVNYQTLSEWAKHKPKLWRVVIAGCVATNSMVNETRERSDETKTRND